MESSRTSPQNRTPSEEGPRKSLPTFIKKLWTIINDPHNELASWTSNGREIWIPDATAFARTVLPKFFKHNNWQSFVRQLNLYGFRKVCGTDTFAEKGAFGTETGWQFRHEHFRRHGEHLLYNIQRRTRMPRMKIANAATPSNQQQQQNHHSADSEVRSRLGRLEDILHATESQYEYLQEFIAQLRQEQTRQNKILESLISLASKTLSAGFSDCDQSVIEEYTQQIIKVRDQCRSCFSAMLPPTYDSSDASSVSGSPKETSSSSLPVSSLLTPSSQDDQTHQDTHHHHHQQQPPFSNSFAPPPSAQTTISRTTAADPPSNDDDEWKQAAFRLAPLKNKEPLPLRSQRSVAVTLPSINEAFPMPFSADR